MQHPSVVVPPFARRGRLARLTVVLVALAAVFASVPSVADAGTFTQVLCASPVITSGAIPNGQLPDGMENPHDYPAMSAAVQTADCADAPFHNGIHVPTAVTTFSPNAGAALTYRAGAELTFRRAVVYRSWLSASSWSFTTTQGPVWNAWSAPYEDRCTGSCLRLGNVTPFSEENTKTILAASSLNGFNLSVLCQATASAPCQADNNGLRFYGATVLLEDAHNPQVVGAPTGSLVTAPVLRGAADVTVDGSDVGAGVYRVKVAIGDTVRLAQVVDPHAGRCADLAPGDADPYQFAVRRPCKPQAGGTYVFDTTQLPEGERSLRVLLEDAAGNTTTVVNRSVTIDNVPPPSVVSAGALAGANRRGSGLALTAATWNDHGAEGEPSVERTWQRCRRNGSACEDVPGAVDATYVLTDADLNRRIRVVETATNSEGRTSATTALTDIVTREDGSLPADNDDLDNDGDGQVDEQGEAWPGPVGPSGAGGSRVGQSGADGAAGRDGVTATVAASARPVNGEGASRRARVSVDAERPVMAFGRTATVTGKLVDEHGRPIRNAVLDVTETPALTGARAASGQSVTTGADGGFRYVATGAAGTRQLVFGYRYERNGDVVSDAAALLTVKAGVRLNVRLRGAIASYRGRVLAGAMPRGGKLVIVQGRVKGGSWQTFASRRAGRTGVFTGRYRLKVRRPGRRLQFRVRVLAESGWNFRGVTSKAVTRTVR